MEAVFHYYKARGAVRPISMLVALLCPVVCLAKLTSTLTSYPNWGASLFQKVFFLFFKLGIARLLSPFILPTVSMAPCAASVPAVTTLGWNCLFVVCIPDWNIWGQELFLLCVWSHLRCSTLYWKYIANAQFALVVVSIIKELIIAIDNTSIVTMMC